MEVEQTECSREFGENCDTPMRYLGRVAWYKLNVWKEKHPSSEVVVWSRALGHNSITATDTATSKSG